MAKIIRQESRDFFEASAHYIDVIAGVAYRGLDLENKKAVLQRIYKFIGCENPRLLQAAYVR
ncbi:hypothetical protein A3K73_06340 [Candidatus Pacearchaeota archaeon RBG_13_36_9]|nr:MAG: hypothetical protein A3K73_06340 [Candidatus Pacearchaeota archaeon RBG_13_36_9]